jgi:hypothetical protein
MTPQISNSYIDDFIRAIPDELSQNFFDMLNVYIILRMSFALLTICNALLQYFFSQEITVVIPKHRMQNISNEINATLDKKKEILICTCKKCTPRVMTCEK